jgi:hypothetical protein
MPKSVAGESPERRRRKRFRLSYPVRFREPGEKVRVETRTEDLSCQGFFCISQRVFSPYETLACELIIPSGALGHLVVVHDMILRCRAEVIRVVPLDPGGPFGVACRFADYTIDVERQIVAQNLTLEHFL